MRYWADTGPVQTNRYWPSIGPVMALYRADTVKWYRANTNTVCKTVPGQYWLAVLGQYRQRYWAQYRANNVMFAGHAELKQCKAANSWGGDNARRYLSEKLSQPLEPRQLNTSQ